METPEYGDFDPTNRIIIADLVAKNVKRQIVLFCEVEASTSSQKSIERLIYKLPYAKELIPFAMSVNLEDLHIFKWDGANLSEPICSIKTGDVLRHYDDEFGSKQIFHEYLTELVSAWLDDFAYHWKTKTPPASEQIAAIGLLPLLERGKTKTDFLISGELEDYADSVY